MFSAAQAARFVAEAHRNRETFSNLPDGLAPRTVEEAYAAQEALSVLWEPRLGPVAGRKIATTTRIMQELMGIDHPCGGMIFASRVFPAPTTIAKADYVNVRIECELAVRVGRDLPGEPGGYTRESVRPAIAKVMAAFELIEDRKADYKTTSALSLIADNAWNGGIVIGPGVDLPAGLELDGIAGSLMRDGRPEAVGRTDDPLGALAWVANLAAARRQPLTAGMVVITGSVITTLDIAPGERLDFTLEGIGSTSMTAV